MHKLYTYVKDELIKIKRPEKIEQQEAYLRNQFSCLGLTTKERRDVYNQAIKLEANPAIDWDLLFACFDDEYRELHYFACYYLEKKKQALTIDDVDKLKKLVQTNSWWDSVDSLDLTIGSIGLVDERLNDIMIAWSTDEDFWVRRIAIDHQLMRKEKTNTQLLETIIVNNFGSDEFFINKAIGWALRQYSKTDPAWVRDFLERYQSQMAKLSIREASKYI
ncbi:3-methyladenine DNA glycosylase AlkD [Breznakia blatticola]|uniref:3-methyladenine DNA glycosylase AlkD n=1 Tax=Breznakia blatticola TaxID=1754012 RepID=A0A4R8ACV6_9FIRM|nr:DNA alkylation repair protein [Breznakia blatticola]TDW26363.1 3-methyladenine DNA glycosylase AlkD [Breznakia blatticola]